MAAEGDFTANGKDYHWYAESFKDEITDYETDNPGLRELHRPGYMVLALEDTDKPGILKHETIITPYENWEDLEYILEHDWGNEGSRKE